MKRIDTMYAAVVVVAAAVWFALLLQPNLNEQTALKMEGDSIRSRLDQFRATMAELPGYVQTQQELASAKRKLNARLYAKDDILDLLKLLQREAEEAGLVLIDITPPVEELLELGKASRQNLPDFLNLRLQLSGNYIDFGRYVGLLEGSPFFRGANYCRVVASSEAETPTHYVFAFKALLGSIEEST